MAHATLLPEQTTTSDEEKRSISWAFVAAGLALGGYGIARKSLFGVVGAGASAYLAYKGIRPGSISRALVDATKTVEERFTRVRTINKPIEVIYSMVSDFENWPQYFPGLESIQLQDAKLKLSMKMPLLANIPLMADLETEPDKRVSIKLFGADRELGSLVFNFTEGKLGTVLSGTMAYRCMFGKVGRFFSKPNLTWELDSFIQRIKELAETGEISRNQ